MRHFVRQTLEKIIALTGVEQIWWRRVPHNCSEDKEKVMELLNKVWISFKTIWQLLKGDFNKLHIGRRNYGVEF